MGIQDQYCFLVQSYNKNSVIKIFNFQTFTFIQKSIKTTLKYQKMTRKFFVGGNFKMNGDRAGLTTIINNINSTSFDPSTVDVVVAPSAVHLDFCKNLADSKCQISSQ